ncbi:MAG: hypothetical protein QM760_04240 [Nibricoccus sp.]
MRIWQALVLCGIFASDSRAADIVLAYSSFGPQVAAHELIGMEWWQWEEHGESHPRDYPIHVAVYWNQTLEQTKQKYPVDRSKEQDYRYVEYSAAVAHLKSTIRFMKRERMAFEDPGGYLESNFVGKEKEAEPAVTEQRLDGVRFEFGVASSARLTSDHPAEEDEGGNSNHRSSHDSVSGRLPDTRRGLDSRRA